MLSLCKNKSLKNKDKKFKPNSSVKPDGSPVTALDQQVETALRAEIRRAAPEHGVYGEEYGAQNAGREWVWILDPIDGTRQFAAGLQNFGTLIALAYQGRPVIGVILQPWSGARYVGVAQAGATLNGAPLRASGETDIAKIVASLANPDSFDDATRPGCDALRAASRWNVFDGGCLGYAALAEGAIGAALNGPDLDPYDIAALIPVVEGAGGVISGWGGERLDATSRGAIVASANPTLHEQTLRLLSA